MSRNNVALFVCLLLQAVWYSLMKTDAIGIGLYVILLAGTCFWQWYWGGKDDV